MKEINEMSAMMIREGTQTEREKEKLSRIQHLSAEFSSNYSKPSVSFNYKVLSHGAVIPIYMSSISQISLAGVFWLISGIQSCGYTHTHTRTRAHTHAAAATSKSGHQISCCLKPKHILFIYLTVENTASEQNLRHCFS